MQVSLPDAQYLDDTSGDANIVIHVTVVANNSPEYSLQGYVTDATKMSLLTKETMRKAAMYTDGQFNIVYVATIGESVRKIQDRFVSMFYPMQVEVISYVNLKGI